MSCTVVILEQQEIVLGNTVYLVYLKEVATSIAPGGAVRKTTVRAYIKKKVEVELSVDT